MKIIFPILIICLIFYLFYFSKENFHIEFNNPDQYENIYIIGYWPASDRFNNMVQANKEYIRLKQNEITKVLANNLEYTKNNSNIRYKINKEKDLEYIEIDGVSMYKIKNKKLFNEIRKLYATGPTHNTHRYRIQVKYIMKNGSVKTEQTLIY